MRFVDVAAMAPVQQLGAQQLPIVSPGCAASDLASLMLDAGLLAEAIDGPAGTAAARKLLGSMLAKGLTCTMVKSRRAAEAEGPIEWFSGRLLDTLTALRARDGGGDAMGHAVPVRPAPPRGGGCRVRGGSAWDGVAVLHSIEVLGIPGSFPDRGLFADRMEPSP